MFTLFLIIPAFVSANDVERDKQAEESFVDRDGDGFDDNLTDEDANGIPDVSENKENEYNQESNEDIEQPTNSPFGQLNTFDLTIYMANSERFGRLSSNCCGISSLRGGFEAGNDFGAGNGIGSGAVSSGCPGGVCY